MIVFIILALASSCSRLSLAQTALVDTGVRCSILQEHTCTSKVKSNSTTWSVNVERSVTRHCEGPNVTAILAIIESETPVQCIDSPKPPPKVPAGYELFPGVGYYKFHPVGAAWARARQACAEEGGHLVIINSENEANVMKQLFSRYPAEAIKNAQMPNDIWVGVYEQGANGRYYTIFGEQLSATGFTRWNPGHPASPGAHDCILLWRTNLGLTEWPSCSVTAPYVCEFQL